MPRTFVTTGSPFERDYAYSRAVVQEPWCFVAGTTGYDYDRMAMPESALEQTRNAFTTIAATLAEAGFSMADVVRVQYTVAAADLADEIAPALREALADVRPAATMVVASFVKPEMKVEIEVTALRAQA